MSTSFWLARIPIIDSISLDISYDIESLTSKFNYVFTTLLQMCLFILNNSLVMISKYSFGLESSSSSYFSFLVLIYLLTF